MRRLGKGSGIAPPPLLRGATWPEAGSQKPEANLFENS